MLRVDGVELGHAGELHPAVCAAYGLPARTSAVEVDLELLIDRAPARGAARAVLDVPGRQGGRRLRARRRRPRRRPSSGRIREAAGALLESVRVFDLYTGAPIPAGRKSLAFALRFRAPDRTLTEAETAEARDPRWPAVVRRVRSRPPRLTRRWRCSTRRPRRTLLAEWRLLRDAGRPARRGTSGASNRPHVTLAARPTLDEDAETALAAAVTGLPVASRLGSLALFGRGPVVLVRLVVVTPALLALHRAVAVAAGTGPDGRRPPSDAGCRT